MLMVPRRHEMRPRRWLNSSPSGCLGRRLERASNLPTRRSCGLSSGQDPLIGRPYPVVRGLDMPLTPTQTPLEAHIPILGRRAGRKYGTGASWLGTFVDLVSLMLAFFVLLFSMTTLDTPRYEDAAGSISASVGQQIVVVETDERPIDRGVRAESNGRGFSLGYLEPILEAKLRRDPLLASTRISREGPSLILSLPSDLLFNPGQARLSGPASTAVRELATALSPLPNRINVIGHADPTPIRAPTARSQTTGRSPSRGPRPWLKVWSTVAIQGFRQLKALAMVGLATLHRRGRGPNVLRWLGGWMW